MKVNGAPFCLPKIPDRECPELPQPEMGSVNMTGREFGGKAIYTCPIGYNVIGVIFHNKKNSLNFFKYFSIFNILTAVKPTVP